MKIGNQDIVGLYLGNQSVRTYLGSQLILPTVTISETWNPSLTDKNKKVIISGEVTLTGKTDCYSLTFEQGGHLTINAGARLRVWEGGITNDDCETVNYLTIYEDAVNDSYGEFLLHPDVSVNNHPNAAVHLYSNGYMKANGAYVYQRFTVPTYPGSDTQIARKDIGYTVPTAMYGWDYATESWKYMESASVFEPFQCYDMTTQAPAPGAEYTFNCEIIGNDNTQLLLPNNLNYFVNGYIGAIKTEHLLFLLHTHNITSIDVCSVNSDWTEINSQNVSQWPYIQPIYCTFVIRNNGLQNLTLNYKDLVWNPSFEEEVTPTRGLMKGVLTSPKPTEIDTTLEGSAIFDNPESPFPPEHDER